MQVCFDCPLHQDERDCEKGSLRPDEQQARPEDCTTVAKFTVRTGLLDQFQAIEPTTSGVEDGDEKN